MVREEDGYSDQALLYAETSPYKIILTDINNLSEDFFNYSLENIEDISEVLLEEIKKNKKKNAKINKMFKVLLRQNSQIKKLEERIENIFYMFIGIFLSYIIYLIIKSFNF